MVSKDSKASSLQDILLNEPHEFLQPSRDLQQLSISLTKRLLDPLATSSRRWRKQNGMDSLHVDGFSVDQVWEQSSSLVDFLINTARLASEQPRTANGVSAKEQDEEGDVEMEEGDDSSEEKEGDDEEIDEGDEDEDEDMEQEDDGDQDEDDDDQDEEEVIGKPSPKDSSISLKPAVRDVHGLNDAFFNIDEFNRDTEQFEDADARGLPVGSDDGESIDWNADPDLMDDDDDDDDDGDEEEEEDEDDDGTGKGAMDMENSLYRDFFVPRQKEKKKKAKKNESARESDEDDEDEEEYEGGKDGEPEFDIGPVHRDLFGQESEGSDDEGSDLDNDDDDEEQRGGARNGQARSSHTRRQAALVEEIRKLERENVAKRDWTLSGEARAAQRPMNSLLEEDLEFERAGKPVPVISQEVTDSLEEMIKRRIVAEEFDELIRRTEPRLAGGRDGSQRRGRIELDDSKPQRSLAEIYEEEHLRAIDPENHPTTASANEQKLKKEIKGMFSDVIRKLDSLSSWHYTPKMPQPAIGIVVDAPTLEIEDAQPSAAGGGPLLGHSNIAPQEVYSAGGLAGRVKDGESPEFVSKGGVPVARVEMSKSEKRKRRRERSQSMKKAEKPSSSSATSSSQQQQQQQQGRHGSNKGAAEAASSSNDRNSIIQKLKSSNVTVIGKDGERRDLDGKSIVEKQAAHGASLKLM